MKPESVGRICRPTDSEKSGLVFYFFASPLLSLVLNLQKYYHTFVNWYYIEVAILIMNPILLFSAPKALKTTKSDF